MFKKNTNVNVCMTKQELLEIVKVNKPQIVYIVDRILKQKGWYLSDLTMQIQRFLFSSWPKLGIDKV
jgi:hypothetical protein